MVVGGSVDVCFLCGCMDVYRQTETERRKKKEEKKLENGIEREKKKRKRKRIAECEEDRVPMEVAPSMSRQPSNVAMPDA